MNMSVTYTKNDKNIVTLCFEMAHRKANVLNQEFIKDFKESLDQLAQEDKLTGVILTSSKKDFIAGADLEMMLAAEEPAEIFEWLEDFKLTIRKLETLGVPVVAAINGSALGGGYEVALACHHRIIINNPKIQIGLPEVTLGLLPGAGGTQRLPRMIGIEKALPLLIEGKRLKVSQAIENGLVDQLAEDREELISKAERWIFENPESKQAWDQKGFKWPGGSPLSPKMSQLWAVAPSMTNQKTYGNYPAPMKILAAVHEGSLVDFDTASRIESRYLVNCITSKEAKNMIQSFWFQLNAINKGQQRPQDVAPYKFQKVGILGAGMMGAGIAYVSAKAGIDVILKDVSLEAAQKGKQYSEKLLEKAVIRGRSSEEDAKNLLKRITVTENTTDLSDCDLIIEAVFEDRKLKAGVTNETEAVIPEHAIFASNTSTIPITGLAEESKRPQQFIGLHFFSPVDKMKLVEIIVGKETNNETLAKAYDYVLQIRKTPIVVNDSRGFYTSRVFTTYVLEGIALLAEGQNPRAIESAGLQAGMPVGPLALSDEVSIELMYKILEQTRKDLAAENKSVAPHPGIDVVYKMVTELKRIGKKSGKGFYDYPKDQAKKLWEGLSEHFPQTETQLSQQVMIERLMSIQSVETIRCMQEGVLTSAGDANIGSIFGWGFAPFKGGTLQYVNDCGVKSFLKRTRHLAETYGERFSPPDLLVEKAQKNERFL